MKRLILGLLACCSSPNPASVDAASSSTGGAALSVESASAPVTVGSVAPPQGTTFLVLQVTLRNTSSAMPLGTLPALFTLATDHQLVLMIAPLQASAAMACTGNQSVATGGSLSCALVFELPTGQLPTSLAYDDGNGHRATSPLPAIPEPDVCVVVGSYTNLADTHCTGCIQSSCGAQQNTAQTQCAASNCGQCELMATPEAKCSCEHSCASAGCWTAVEATSTCIRSQCASQCM